MIRVQHLTKAGTITTYESNVTNQNIKKHVQSGVPYTGLKVISPNEISRNQLKSDRDFHKRALNLKHETFVISKETFCSNLMNRIPLPQLNKTVDQVSTSLQYNKIPPLQPNRTKHSSKEMKGAIVTDPNPISQQLSNLTL